MNQVYLHKEQSSYKPQNQVNAKAEKSRETKTN